MSNKRKTISPNEDLFFIAEVSGICPICNNPLMYQKNKRKYKQYEIAHIYPLNPTKTEAKILANCIKLSDNADDDANKIALCVSCHTKFDKPRTIDEYNQLYKLKYEITNNKSIKKMMNDFPIQDEIIEIINTLISLEDSPNTPLNMTALQVDNKISDPLLCKKIKDYVAEYFNFIGNVFKSYTLTNKVYNSILYTFKLLYIKVSMNESSQQKIFENLCDWLKLKTKNDNKVANEIVVSYFIQHCEVFDDISK